MNLFFIITINYIIKTKIKIYYDVKLEEIQ
ncbi:hypothetical protein ERTO105960_07460 [Erysipelothrix tonsillarum]